LHLLNSGLQILVNLPTYNEGYQISFFVLSEEMYPSHRLEISYNYPCTA